MVQPADRRLASFHGYESQTKFAVALCRWPERGVNKANLTCLLTYVLPTTHLCSIVDSMVFEIRVITFRGPGGGSGNQYTTPVAEIIDDRFSSRYVGSLRVT
jgi:hypothetical protein